MHDKAVEYLWNIHRHTIKRESEKNQINAAQHICIFVMHACGACSYAVITKPR
jgi:hypothetical protein